MATANERLLDGQIGHQVDLQRYSNGVVRRIIGLLNCTDADLFAQVTAALDRLPATSFTVERLEGLLISARQINLAAYTQIERELTTELRALVEYEGGFQQQLFQAEIPPQVQARIAVAPINPSEVYAAAFAQPFRGRLLREWAAKIESDRMARIRDAIRMGYVEQQTISQIVQRLRGTRAKGYSDGVIEIDRQHAETVVRTAISHVAGFTRDRFSEQNDDLIKAQMWVSTLDTRTSDDCRVRDGKQYTAKTHRPIGHSIPWLGGPGRLHWQCRSTSVPVLKSWHELGLDVDELAPGTRASMDGQVPADLTYGEWLRKQSVKRQDQILGPSRAALFRQGRLPIERFANDKGKWLTLDELKAKEAKAFETAGLLNPMRPPRGMPQDEIARFLASPEAQTKLLERLHSENGLSMASSVRHVGHVKEVEGYRSSIQSLTAIRYYTGPGFRPINQRMREVGGTLEDRQFTALTAEGLKGITENRRTIWRAPTRTARGSQTWWDKATVSQPLELGNQLQSFSTSQELSAAWAMGGDVLLRVAKPRVGAYIEPLTMNPGEHEVLLPPGLVYRVFGKSTEVVGGRTFRVIDLEIEDRG